MTKSLNGLRFRCEYFDLVEVDVSYSLDKKSFDARAVLRSTYHTAFLQHGLASLPEPQPEEEPEAEPEPEATMGPRARRAAAAAPAAAAAAPRPRPSLHNADLVQGRGDAQIYPTRLVSRSLDGASVNMGDKAGVVALMKKENPAVVGVHAIAHVLELSWGDALKNKVLIKRILVTNQKAYNHYAKSGKKRLTFKACCELLGEDESELLSMHGIRWREASFRATVNLLKTWRARCTDLLEEASLEVGAELTPLSAPELFLKKQFRLKTADRREPYTLTIQSYEGEEGGQHWFKAVYHTRTREVEKFSKENVLACLLDDSTKKEALLATDAGQLLLELTDYAYVKGLHFWADITAQGKMISKIFQRNGVLLSDVTAGVEDAEHTVSQLPTKPGPWMKAFEKDYDSDRLALDGIELHSIEAGEAEYNTELVYVCTDVNSYINERFCKLLSDPVLGASVVFEHARWPDFSTSRAALEAFGDDKVMRLLSHFDSLLELLGCEKSKVLGEWGKIKLEIARDDNLRSMPYATLWQRMFDQFSSRDNPCHYYNVLLVVAIVHCFAIDTSICERGFSLMNMLKTARRSKMGTKLLRMLMVICSLGAEWKDPTKARCVPCHPPSTHRGRGPFQFDLPETKCCAVPQIPVDEIIDIWRDMAKRGRYEGLLWRAHMLRTAFSPEGDGSGGSGAEGTEGAEGAEGDAAGKDGPDVNAENDSGFFARWGEAATQRRGEHAGVYLGIRRVQGGELAGL